MLDTNQSIILNCLGYWAVPVTTIKVFAHKSLYRGKILLYVTEVLIKLLLNLMFGDFFLNLYNILYRFMYFLDICFRRESLKNFQCGIKRPQTDKEKQ